MKSNFIKVWKILKTKERRQLLFVAGLQVLSGLMDMLGVISILPFLSLAADPTFLSRNETLGGIQDWFGYSNEKFLILMGMMSLGMLILNQVVRLTSGWSVQYVSHGIWWSLHRRMFRYYLHQPYLYHLQHSSTELLEKLQVRTNAAMAGVIQPIFLLIGLFFSMMFIVGALVWADPLLTSILLGVIGTFYFLVY